MKAVAALSAKLRSVEGGANRGIMHWCPGCEEAHVIWTHREVPGQPTWEWDGNVDAPTCKPSVLCFTTIADDYTPIPPGRRRTLCHYFLTNGELVFCGDSPHALAGKTIPLPDFPKGE